MNAVREVEPPMQRQYARKSEAKSAGLKSQTADSVSVVVQPSSSETVTVSKMYGRAKAAVVPAKANEQRRKTTAAATICHADYSGKKAGSPRK